MTRLCYFAYGSNLSLPRLRARVPSCQVLTTASLAGYSLRFHKRGRDGSAKCDAFWTGEAAERVLGVVYLMSIAERSALDKAEDLGQGYDAHWVEVQSAQGPLEALTYCARKEMIDSRLQPFDWYHAFVLGGAREQGLPEAYIQQLSAVVSRQDPDRARCAFNRRLLRGSSG